MINSGKKLIKLGAKNVFDKGGHKNSIQIEDIFINNKEIKIFKNKRLRLKILMVLVAHYQVQLQHFIMWKTFKEICELGIKYVNQAIKSNLNYGKGHGPINHLTSFNIKNEFKI